MKLLHKLTLEGIAKNGPHLLTRNKMGDAIKKKERKNWLNALNFLFSMVTKKECQYVDLVSSAQVGGMTPHFKNFQYSNINLRHVFNELLGLVLNHCQVRCLFK